MKRSLLLCSSTAAVVLLAAAALILTSAAQTPQGPQAASGNTPPQPRSYPAPTNLKVLPRDLTGQQVHEIMEKWSAYLGTHCDSCHAADPKNIGPNGRPRLNFADDSKPMKDSARLMFNMTEKINLDYVSMIDSSGAPVTCGTCHRGHLGPEPFVIPPEAEPHTPQAPPPSGDNHLPH
ncbi:MAG: c-type cytochrome [Terracidiphilus sp.]